MARRNSGSLSYLTGMTPPGTPKTPTEVEAEKEAKRVQMQGQQLANEQVSVQNMTRIKWRNSHLKQEETQKSFRRPQYSKDLSNIFSTDLTSGYDKDEKYDPSAIYAGRNRREHKSKGIVSYGPSKGKFSIRRSIDTLHKPWERLYGVQKRNKQAETQKMAGAKRARETRRSTQEETQKSFRRPQDSKDLSNIFSTDLTSGYDKDEKYEPSAIYAGRNRREHKSKGIVSYGPSKIMGRKTMLNACGNKKVQEDHYIVDDDYLHKRTQDKSPVEFDVENEIRIVLIGKTGCGKSATGNTILGKIQFESKVSASSVTNKCKRGEEIQAGKKVIVVDTPGLFDTGMTNENITKEIVKCISMTSPGPHAMVLVLGIGRFTKEEQDTVQHFVDHFGEGMLKYMIVLFTRKDDLSKANQSIDQYVGSVPNELKTILRQCGDRYIAFNNNAEGNTKREQVSKFFDMVDSMLTRNGGSCYTNDLYAEAEATLQRRMHHQKKILEKEKQQEKDESIRQVENKYEQELKKIILEKNSLEEALKTTKLGGRRDIETRVESLQQQLHAVDKGNIEREKERLQRDLDETNRRYEKTLEEKNNEIKEHVKKKEIEYESKMNSENLRKRERDNIENENQGAIDDIIRGLKQIGSGMWKAGKKILSLF